MIPVLADVLREWPERHYGRGGWSYGGGDGLSVGDGCGWGTEHGSGHGYGDGNDPTTIGLEVRAEVVWR